MNWKNEHPQANVPDAIANHPDLIDTSWHNDMMPTFIRKVDDGADGSVPTLAVDYEDPAMREEPTWPRFAVYQIVENGSDVRYEGDDMSAALAALLEEK